MDEIQTGQMVVESDVLVIGGGTAGPTAAYKAKRRNPAACVVLLEKANVKRSGAISMGMDGLNNAVVPGHSTPEQYTKEITIANDGICNQSRFTNTPRDVSTSSKSWIGSASVSERPRTAISTSRRCITSVPTSCRCRMATRSKKPCTGSCAVSGC